MGKIDDLADAVHAHTEAVDGAVKSLEARAEAKRAAAESRKAHLIAFVSFGRKSRGARPAEAVTTKPG